MEISGRTKVVNYLLTNALDFHLQSIKGPLSGKGFNDQALTCMLFGPRAIWTRLMLLPPPRLLMLVDWSLLSKEVV